MPNKHLALTAGNWDDLNDFLGVSINTDGTLKGSVSAVTYFVTDDGATSKAYAAVAPFTLLDSDTNSSSLAQRVLNLMDLNNGGTGGKLHFSKQTAGAGYRWNTATPRVPLEVGGATDAGAINISCDPGTVVVLSQAAPTLFLNHRSFYKIAQAGFTDDATIYVDSIVAAAYNNKPLPASGFVNVGSALVQYTGVTDSGVPGATRYALTGCTSATHAAIVAGATPTTVSVAYENWQNVEIHGFIVNAAALTGIAASYNIIAGQYQAGGWTNFAQRLNQRNVSVYGNTIVNAPSDRQHYGVYLATQHLDTNEATQTTIVNPRVFGNKVAGSSHAVVLCNIAGKCVNGQAAPTVANQFLDDIYIGANKSSAGAISGNHVQIGGCALVGTVRVVDGNDFRFSTDDIVEINNVQKLAVVAENYMEDAATSAVLFRNFVGGGNAGAHEICRDNQFVQKTQLAGSWRAYNGTDAASTHGTITAHGNVLDLTAVTATISATNVSLITYGDIGTAKALLAKRVESWGNRVLLGSGGITLSGARTLAAFEIAADPQATVELAGGPIPDSVTGTVTFAAASSGYVLGFQHFGNVRFLDYRIINDITGSGSVPTSGVRCVQIGQVGGATITTAQASGRLDIWNQQASGGTPKGLEILGTANLTMPAPLLVKLNDAGLVSGQDVLYSGVSNIGNVWFTLDSIFAAAVAKTNPAVGVSPATVTNDRGYWVLACVTGGSSVTIAHSEDGTQSNATSLATGTSLMLGPKQALIIGYVTTPPTVTFVPMHLRATA